MKNLEIQSGKNLLNKLVEKNSNLNLLRKKCLITRIMKLFYILSNFIFLNSCSFDKNSGIWKNDNN